MSKIRHLPTRRNTTDEPAAQTELRRRVAEQADGLAAFAVSAGDDVMCYERFEKALRDKVFELARTVIALFLFCAERTVREQTPTRQTLEGRVCQRTTGGSLDRPHHRSSSRWSETTSNPSTARARHERKKI